MKKFLRLDFVTFWGDFFKCNSTLLQSSLSSMWVKVEPKIFVSSKMSSVESKTLETTLTKFTCDLRAL